MKNKKVTIIALSIAIIVILMDQISKFAILRILKDVGNINILPFFDLTLVYNKGISFGMLNGASKWELSIIATITIAIVSFLLNWLRKTESKYRATCIGLIIGGAIGNTIDRFLHIGVVDFLDFYIKNRHYPAFNVADSCICIGVVLLLIENVFIKDLEK